MKKKMNFIPEKLRSESILDFLKNQTVISMKETQFKSVVRNKLNLDEKNTKESLHVKNNNSTAIYGFMTLFSWVLHPKNMKNFERPCGKYERKSQN